ncbi:MAG: universal stress protein [Ferruginibacter sp.]
MNTNIKNILVPVDLKDHSLSALKHATALAIKHGSDIHLLHVISNSSLGIIISSAMHFAMPNALEEIMQVKQEVLDHWKTMMELKNNVHIITIIKQGNPTRQINEYAKENNIDFIVVGMNEHRKWLSKLSGSTAKYITRSAKIPVMTIFHKPEGIFEWQNVVLPVNISLPEKRVKAILNFAMEHSIKIHFVAISHNIEQTKSEQFHLLLESLKLVKAFGNIPVECKSLNGTNLLTAAWEYAASIHADAIIVNSASAPQLKLEAISTRPNWYENLFMKTFTESF